MILWATEFPASTGTTADALLALSKEWLKASPHHKWGSYDFPPDPENDIGAYECDSERVSIARATAEGGTWTGLQHIWIEDGKREWSTEIVTAQIGGRCTVAVRVECHVMMTGVDLSTAKKPYIIKLLMERVGGGADSWLTVDDTPTFLAEDQVDDAAAIVHGTTAVRLPVVYVTAGSGHRPFVDARELARWLSGMAHVVVEPSRHFSFVLARNVARTNPYGGAVGVFWPRASEPCSRFLPRDFDDAESLSVAVAALVREALVTVRPTPELTWVYLRELVSRARVERLRAEGTGNLDEYAAEFDAEIAVKNDRIAESDREIARLHAENRRLAAASSSAGALVARGKEGELYPGELTDTVVHALKLASASVEADGRRKHILTDLLVSNTASGNDDQIAEELKRMFAQRGDLTGTTRHELEDLGFEVTDDGKHHKAVFRGDARYTFSISKSSSDHRAGKNLASTIVRKLFK